MHLPAGKLRQAGVDAPVTVRTFCGRTVSVMDTLGSNPEHGTLVCSACELALEEDVRELVPEHQRRIV